MPGGLGITRRAAYILVMRVLCVGRHPYLTEHLCRFFGELGVHSIPAVGMSEAMRLVPEEEPDAIVCDYDLLATIPLARWEQDPALANVPLIAVSLNRQPGDAHLMDVNGIAGFLYLPTLEPANARRILAAARGKRAGAGIVPPDVLQWPGSTPVAPLR